MLRKGLPFGMVVNKYLKQFPGLEYTGTQVYCKFCDCNLMFSTKQACEKHVICKKHIRNEKNAIPYWKFIYDFLFVMSVSNIPMNIVENKHFKLFWKAYVPGWKLPTRNQLRYWLPHVKNSIETLIKSKLKNKKIWLTVHETTNAKNKRVANILVRTLNVNGSSLPYLLCSRILQQTNTESIVNLVKEVLVKFGITSPQVLMLVSDGAAYMLKAGQFLKESFPRLLHITCLIHAFHLVAETISKSYPQIDKLIFETTNIFLKSPKRIHIFQTMCPKVPLPPQPVFTQYGTWLEAAVYYNKYYEQVKSVISIFTLQEAKSIHECQQLFENPQVKEDLQVISQQYPILIDSLSNLQHLNLTLEEALSVIKNLQNALNILTDIPGQCAHEKLCSILNKNPDFKKLLEITHQEESDINAQFLKFANITLYDAQRSFSNYTHTFSQCRRKLTQTNMEGFLMMQFYAKSINATLTFDLKKVEHAVVIK